MPDTITAIVDHVFTLIERAEQLAAEEAQERKPGDQAPVKLLSTRQDVKLALEREIRQRLRLAGWINWKEWGKRVDAAIRKFKEER